MVLQLLASSNTSNENQSEAFDYFCSNLFVGPLVWGSVSVPCACVGVPASVWLLWVLIQRQRSGLSNDIYMLNLTIMEFIYNISIAPTTINYLFLRNKFISILEVVFSCFNNTGRPLLLAFICVDCYIAVVFPIAYRKMKNSKHRIVACALAWVLTFFYGVTFVLELDITILYITYMLLSYGLTVLTITFCDLSILYALRKPDPSGRTGVHPQKQRALQIITNSLIMALISYLPPLLVYHLFNLPSLTPQQVKCSLVIPSLIFPRLGSTIMPLLYLGNLGSFKNVCGFHCLKL